MGGCAHARYHQVVCCAVPQPSAAVPDDETWSVMLVADAAVAAVMTHRSLHDAKGKGHSAAARVLYTPPTLSLHARGTTRVPTFLASCSSSTTTFGRVCLLLLSTTCFLQH